MRCKEHMHSNKVGTVLKDAIFLTMKYMYGRRYKQTLNNNKSNYLFYVSSSFLPLIEGLCGKRVQVRFCLKKISAQKSLKFSLWTSFQLVNIALYFFRLFPPCVREITYAKNHVSAVGTLWKLFVDRKTKETFCLLRQ